ncbi:hypothetical protein O181_083542 [Austropuccinia psidii MF-1]|uniref:Uncharacterized protein n=1 Tax=Austropuccinia psidii MF-1 TaxID=1389203 RepID=A0A9Q3FUM0_9BASI|nr:hypothetical protein [Austropuccinia psidii MF-1]
MEHPHAVPIAPDTSLLQEFNNRFKSSEEIKKMAEIDTSIPLIPQDQTVVADAFKVAFLPDASQSIRGIKHPDERLSDQNFTEKYWERCTADYDLSHKISKEDEDLDSNDDEAEISDDHIEEENSEMHDYKEQELNTLLDRDTEMAHEEDLDEFVVGGSGFSVGDNEWSGGL